jgi:hypothetical protein
MADAGVVRDANRLPWLEPYRAPPRKKSNRKAGLTAALGGIGLAAVVTLLTRDLVPFPAEEPLPQASPRSSFQLWRLLKKSSKSK